MNGDSESREVVTRWLSGPVFLSFRRAEIHAPRPSPPAGREWSQLVRLSSAEHLGLAGAGKLASASASSLSGSIPDLSTE